MGIQRETRTHGAVTGHGYGGARCTGVGHPGAAPSAEGVAHVGRGGNGRIRSVSIISPTTDHTTGSGTKGQIVSIQSKTRTYGTVTGHGNGGARCTGVGDPGSAPSAEGVACVGRGGNGRIRSVSIISPTTDRTTSTRT